MSDGNPARPGEPTHSSAHRDSNGLAPLSDLLPTVLAEAARDLRDCTDSVIDNGQMLANFVTAALNSSRASSQQVTGHAIAELTASREACTAAAESLRRAIVELGTGVESANSWVRTMGMRMEAAERALGSARVALDAMTRSATLLADRKDQLALSELKTEAKRSRRLVSIAVGICGATLVVTMASLAVILMRSGAR